MTELADEIGERSEASEEYLAIEQAWSDCMEQNGLAVDEGTNDLYEGIHSRINEVFSSSSEPTLEDFREVLDYEIELARIELLTCEGGPYAQKALDEARPEIEREVVEENIAVFLD